jgi:hypothetical protein
MHLAITYCGALAKFHSHVKFCFGHTVDALSSLNGQVPMGQLQLVLLVHTYLPDRLGRLVLFERMTMFSAPALQVARPVHEIQGFNSEIAKEKWCTSSMGCVGPVTQ